MKIRIIQLMNNFFRDENDKNVDRKKPLGEYCTFGYFDALQVEGGDISDAKKSLIWKNIENVAVNTFDGTCSRRNLVCITDEEEKDKIFWENAEQFPYLFVSLIRMKHDNENMKTMLDVINEIKNNDKAITYFSYNHSELVIAKFDNGYARGMEFVLSLRKKLASLNIYSIFSVREDIIKSKTELQNKIENEEVSVQLRLMIKNDQKIADFLESLWRALFKDQFNSGKNEEENFEKYYTLGSNDMMVRINQIKMYKLLSCYSMGNLLTHTNKKFEAAVYNIQTEILVKGDYIKYGEPVDRRETNGIETTVQ